MSGLTGNRLIGNQMIASRLREQPGITAHGRRVAIVGGGIAGLAAASAISEALPQIEVTLLESRRTLGGRAGSFVDPVTSETVDYCQHVAMGCCTNLLDWLERSGLKDEFTCYESLTFFHPGHGHSAFRPNLRIPAPMHLHRALAGLSYLRIRDRVQISRAIAKLMWQSEGSLSDMTAAQWLDQNRQSQRLRERFWDVILVSALGDVPERVSMSAARKVIIDGFAGAHNAADVWVPNRPLSQIFGEMMQDRLTRSGVRVITGTTVREIHQMDDETNSIELRCDGDVVHADHVILATSWRPATKLIGSIEFAANERIHAWKQSTIGFLSSIQPSPITGLHLWFDRELTPLPHVVMVGTISQWLFKQPLRTAESDRPGIHHQVVISGQHRYSDAPKAELLAKVLDELCTAFPNVFDSSNPPQLLHHRIVTDPNAVYSVTPDFQTQRPATTTPCEWLSLAGDYVATGWPATMEGAVISGRLAANAVCQWFGGQPAAFNCLTPPISRGSLAKWLIR